MANLKSWVGFGEKAEQAVHFHHPGVQLANKEQAAILFEAMQQLPENQRIAFVLIKTEDLRYNEVADIMNLTIKSVEALMHRAKENLRKQLKNYYSDRS